MIATTSGRRRPICTISSAKTEVQPNREGATGRPVSGWICADGVEPVGHVLLGRLVAAALLGDHVHDHRPAEGLGPPQGGLDGRDVVTVDRTDVLQAQVLEHALRGDDVLDALLQPVQRVVGQAPGRPRTTQRALAPGEHVLVAASGAQRVEVVGQAADGRVVGAPVVVDDDHQSAVLPGGDVVERLPGHPPGQRAVADDRDDVAVGGPAQGMGLGDAVGPAQGRRGVRVLHDVVLGLGAARVPAQPAATAQLGEVGTAGEQLVHVGLVARVEHHRVAGRLEDAVHRDGQLDDPEVGSQVPTGARDGLHEEGADLLGEGCELLRPERPHVSGAGDPGQRSHPSILRSRSPVRPRGRQRPPA